MNEASLPLGSPAAADVVTPAASPARPRAVMPAQALAALGLTAFSGGLLAVYRKTPGLTQSDGIRPTPAGVPMAKDVWLAGIGVALLIDRKHHPVKARRKVAQARAAQAKTAIKSAVK